jgi:hypothetical protein
VKRSARSAVVVQKMNKVLNVQVSDTTDDAMKNKSWLNKSAIKMQTTKNTYL